LCTGVYNFRAASLPSQRPSQQLLSPLAAVLLSPRTLPARLHQLLPLRPAPLTNQLESQLGLQRWLQHSRRLQRFYQLFALLLQLKSRLWLLALLLHGLALV